MKELNWRNLEKTSNVKRYENGRSNDQHRQFPIQLQTRSANSMNKPAVIASVSSTTRKVVSSARSRVSEVEHPIQTQQRGRSMENQRGRQNTRMKRNQERLLMEHKATGTKVALDDIKRTLPFIVGTVRCH